MDVAQAVRKVNPRFASENFPFIFTEHFFHGILYADSYMLQNSMRMRWKQKTPLYLGLGQSGRGHVASLQRQHDTPFSLPRNPQRDQNRRKN